MKNNETPTQEQSILSIEDRAENYANQFIGITSTQKIGIEKDFIAGVKSMIPIIKELGEALKMVKNTANRTWDSIQEEDFAVGVMLGNIETTLDKYKQYL